MLRVLRDLALLYLWNELQPGSNPPINLFAWFKQMRQQQGGLFFRYLVENPEKIHRFYVLKADPTDPQTTILEGYEMGSLSRGDPQLLIPFCKPTGAQSAQLGPVLKRSFNKSKKTAEPSPKVLQTTLKEFKELSQSPNVWNRFFQEVYEVWTRPKVKYGNECWSKPGCSALEVAVAKIPEEKETVFLVYQDKDGKYPGERIEYIDYLTQQLALSKYATSSAPPREHETCPLCGTTDVTVYLNACAGAGFNFFNMDREGVFPGLSIAKAHHRFALCVDCADLLFIAKNYLKEDLLTVIAGSKVLVIPHFEISVETQSKVIEDFRYYLHLIQEGTTQQAVQEEKYDLARRLQGVTCVSTLDILWADFGQKIENIYGVIVDVLPSRIREIEEICGSYQDSVKTFPYAPKFWLNDDFRLSANLRFIDTLLKYRGGSRVDKQNKSLRRANFKRELIEAIYHRRPIHFSRLYREIISVATSFIIEAMGSKDPISFLCYEGGDPKKQKRWLSFAGWIRHVASILELFKNLGIINYTERERSMLNWIPRSEELKKFINVGGLDTEEKAFAFILGILYGRVMQIQSRKGVNVLSNTLPWLRKLQLQGKDLPDLFIKVREKLLVYEADKDERVRTLIADLADLGTKIGTRFSLNRCDTCYFLLLGQALVADVLPKIEKNTI